LVDWDNTGTTRLPVSSPTTFAIFSTARPETPDQLVAVAANVA